MALLRTLLAVVTAGLGLWAVSIYVHLPVAHWIPDLAVAGAAVALAVSAWRVSWTVSVLALALAGSWWAGTVWSPALYWHRGVLIHLILLAQLTRRRSRIATIVVIAGYLASVISPAWQVEILALSLGGVVLCVAIFDPVGARRRGHPVASGMFALAVSLGALAPALSVGAGGQLAVTIGYDLLVVGAVGVLGRSVRFPSLVQLTDLAVDLGGRAPDIATLTEQARREPGLDVDGSLQAALAAAQRLEDANRRMHDQLREALQNVRASRQRLVVADATERARLGADLEETVIASLRSLAADAHQPGGPALLRAQEALAATITGLRPPGLADGLAAALRGHPLVRSLDCVLVLAEVRCADVVEDTLYSVAAEALTNVAKHAGPCRTTVRFELVGTAATLSVADDGSGGATPNAGSGLSELADRLEALQGSLTVETVAGVGTTITASVPRELTGAGLRPRSADDTPAGT